MRLVVAAWRVTPRLRAGLAAVAVALLFLAGALLGRGARRELPPPPPLPPPRFDLLLRGGWVVDGTGRPPFRADVGIRGDRIAAVGDLSRAVAGRVLSVPDRFVAPGFINPHSHIDTGLERDRDVAPSLLQGITTELVGLDGEAPLDVDGFLRRLTAGGGIGVNVGTFAGHATIRRAVLGDGAGPPTPEQLARMQELLQESLAQGAFGLSTGLEYVPGRYAGQEELAALARVLAPHRGVYVSHVRNERDRVVSAVQEALDIGRAAGVAVHISHIKISRRPGWPGDRQVLVDLARQVVARIDAARATGQEVYADLYPYAVPWFLTRRPLHRAYPAYPLSALEPLVDQGAGGNGKTLAELAAEEGVSPARILERLRSRYGDFPVAVHAIDEETLRLFLRRPFTMIGVDAPSPGGPWWGGVSHPRGFGTYPRVLGRYVRELGLLSWPEAVYKMTGLPARVYGLTGRGVVEPGAYADLAVFDPETVRDRATYLHPERPPAGIEYVLVNGRIAVEQGELVRVHGSGGPLHGVRAGRALRAAR